jgi:hypothetical protein
VKWHLVATWSPVAGLGCAVALLWALVARLQQWQARSFVLLCYGVLICAVLSHLVPLLSRRSRPYVPPPLVRELRALLTLLAVLAVLWFWCTPLMEPLIGWCIRQVPVWRFD